MTRPAIVPFRWPGHGLDLRAYLHPSGPLFFADDLDVALELNVPAEFNHRTGHHDFAWPDGHTVFEDLLQDDGRPVVLYRPAVVLELATARPTASTADFVAWFEELAATLVGEQLAAAAPVYGRHAVADAARLLTTETALSFTRDSLFTALHELEWITRLNRIWIPTTAALRAGVVVREHVWVAGIKSTYPQVFITALGLEQLSTLLPLAAANTLTFVEYSK